MKKVVIILLIGLFLSACAAPQALQRQTSSLKIGDTTYSANTEPGGIISVVTSRATVFVDHSKTMATTTPPPKGFLATVWGAFISLFKAAGEVAL